MSGNGQDLIRAALLQRRDKMQAIAESVDCGAEALNAYTRKEVVLSPDVLMALARELFDGSYDVARDAVLLTGAPPRNVIDPKAERFH